MDFTLKIIPLFFLLVLLANYFNFMGFFYVMKSLPGNKGRKLRRRTKSYFIIMNCLYAGVLALAFVPGFRPMCHDHKTYPAVMNFASCLFLINYVFHWYVKCNKKFFMDDDSALLSAATCINEGAEGVPDRKLSWESKEESLVLRQRMVQRQMSLFMCFSTILVTFNCIIQVWGRFLSEKSMIGCADKGYQWVYTSLTGSLFVTAHIVQIVMQAVMLEKALYKVPHEDGWFEAPNENCFEPTDETEETPRDEGKGDDDGFARTA